MDTCTSTRFFFFPFDTKNKNLKATAALLRGRTTQGLIPVFCFVFFKATLALANFSVSLWMQCRLAVSLWSTKEEFH